jgi:hypothetical protein
LSGSSGQLAGRSRSEHGHSALAESITTTGVLTSLGMSLLDTKRLELERGEGGDHDTSYHFTLPVSVKKQLVWAHLQTRVQAGELPS